MNQKNPTNDQRLMTKVSRIAYLGIPGSYTHTAALKYFGAYNSFLPSKTISDVFEYVISGTDEASFGIAPLENSLHGNVVETFDILGEKNLSIVGEVYLRIHHCLLGPKTRTSDSTLKSVKRCYSHWQAISQCEPFFKNHPWITPVFTGDTATAAKDVSDRNRKDEVAIASREAGILYGLQVLATGIEKFNENFTRFSVIGQKQNKIGEKATISFIVKHVPGSLVHALTPLAKNGINLMQIESRPLRNTPWEYNFYVDLETGTDVSVWQKALKELKASTTAVKILGRYKKGELYET